MMWLVVNIQTVLGILDLFNGIFTVVSTESIFDIWNIVPVAVEYRFPQAQIARINALANDTFPDDFYFGVTTSAYPTEGGWNVSDKGPSVWDAMTHANPSLIVDGNNGDVASDSYYHFDEDIQLAKSIGSNMYRISLSWSRILPNGLDNYISADGIRYYNDVIDTMIENDITPMVTLYHHDLPYTLQQLGGWTNPLIITWFVNYANVAFQVFGNRVKYWVTINSPANECHDSYGTTFIPAVNQSGTADYLCGHHVLLAHASVYELYSQVFQSRQHGKLGIAIDLKWFEPENPESVEDVVATERAYQFYNGWFMQPIFGLAGDYPTIMRNRINDYSFIQSFPYSRLPVFSKAEKRFVKYSADFLGINYYTTFKVRGVLHEGVPTVDFQSDAGILILGNLGLARGEFWVKDNPQGFRALLQRINEEYHIPQIFITENGYADHGQTDDLARAVYHHSHLSAVKDAMKKGLDIRGYLIWSLIDTFEWDSGFTTKFGLFKVDFKDENRPRTPKLSSRVVADVYKTKKIRHLQDILAFDVIPVDNEYNSYVT